MTTPDEFLQFAKDMGLGSTKSTLSTLPSRSMSNNNGYTTTGLSVLNNLCRLIEQIHQLKAENNHLRAHLDLVDNVDKFQQRFLFKQNHENNKEDHKKIISSKSHHDEEKLGTISPTNSLEIKQSKLNRDQKGINYGHSQEDSPPILQTDQDQSDLIDTNSGVSSARTWNKVRHALKFSLGKKHGSSNTPHLSHSERQIPTISISIESDDEHLQENKRLKKKKKIITTNDNRYTIVGEDTDQDDESIRFVRAYHKRRLDGNETPTSSSTDRQETSSVNVPFNTSNADDEVLLTRKLSKIARYRRKLRSKFDTVKKQFSDQHPSSSTRFFHHSHGLTFDDIGLGLNQSLLKAQLAPALTKSYQEKMRAWETIQKSDFLVNYRRQSILPKIDTSPNSRKTSMLSSINEPSQDPTIPSSTIDNCSSIVEELNVELETNLQALGPILSPNQRSLIVHQWREIMSEEISLRHYNEYLQNRMIVLKELETNLKTLKTNIFCTNYILKQQSMINIHDNDQYQQSYLPQRCRSLQSLISIPASWILAVQSAAYSDVLDGTSFKTTERTILFNKNFFDQLENFKQDRQKFEEESIKDLQLLSHTNYLSLNKNRKNPETFSNENRLNKSRVKFVLARGCLRKLSLISYSEFPQYFLPDPAIPLQTIIAPAQSTSNIHLRPTTITNEIDSKTKLSISSGNIDKRPKRSLFDFKKSFERSRSVCATQINSWFRGRRQRHVSAERQRSPTGSTLPTPLSTPKLLGSPRLGRLRQKLFKQQSPSSPKADHTPHLPQTLDDSINRSQYDLPVRIYFPSLTPPISRPVCLTGINMLTTSNDQQDVEIDQTSNLTTPIIHRKYSSSSSSSPSLKKTTAKERRESFATLSNIFHNKFL